MNALDGAARWGHTPALRRALLVVAVGSAAAVVTGRPELVALVAPLAVVTGMSLAVPAPRRVPTVAVRAPASAPQGAVLEVVVEVDAGPGAELAVVRLPDGAGAPHGRTLAAALSAEGRRRLVALTRTVSWGTAGVARPDLLVAGRDGMSSYGPVKAAERRCVVLPTVDRVPPVALPPRPAGVVGSHRTRRPGDGSDLLDIRRFTPGDRIRRVDWRVSARTGELHVRRTAVDADADVVLCLDTRADLSTDVAAWTSPKGPGPGGAMLPGSSLDVAVRAAASLAAAHLRQGDRVAVVDLAHPRVWVRPGTGRRQLLLIQRRLTAIGVQIDARRLGLRPGSVPPAATVVVLSPLLDDAIVDLVASLRRRSGDVVAFDVLPQPLRTPTDQPDLALAVRLMLSERAERLAALTHHGVLVLRWDPQTFAAAMVRRSRQRSRGAA